MRISQALYDEMVAHALADAAIECCGMLAARDGEAIAVHRAQNAAPAPRYGYEIASDELLRISTAIDDAGLEIGAIYHSHPRTAPEPSQTDINLAFYPDAIYIIIGLADPSAPEVRSWRIRDGEVTEAPLELV